MRLFYQAFGLMLLLAGILFAQNYPAFPVGEDWQFPDARTLGLAGAGSVSNTTVAALMLNPAALANHPAGLDITLSPALRNLEERRSFPIFDRFGDINQYGIYVINDNWKPVIQGGVQYSFGATPIPYLKALAVGVFNEIDQRYDYEEDVRQNEFPDDPLALNTISFDGKLIRYSLGAAFRVLENWSLGVQGGILNGDLEQTTAVSFVGGSSEDYSESSSRSLKNTPLVLSLGTTFQANPRLSVGGHLRLPYTVDYDVVESATGAASQSDSYRESHEYPYQLTMGLEYRSQQILQARLNVDVTYEWWSAVEYERDGQAQDPNYDDVFKIKAGIEHIFFNQIPFQVGVQYRTFFLDHRNTRLLFSAGTGFMGRNWEVGAAGGFCRVDYPYPDLFDDQLYGGDRSNSLFDDVAESYFFGVITLKVKVR